MRRWGSGTINDPENIMTHKTWRRASIDGYIQFEGDPEEIQGRNLRLQQFPYAIMLELAYPELDFAQRWCWENVGPMDGICTQAYSEYPVCTEAGTHSHCGAWTSHWFAKTEYNFGYNEFYFAKKDDLDAFIAYLPQINWGEKYPK